MDRYRVSLPSTLSYVSRDVDFLAESAAAAAAVRRLASVLGGHAIFPKRRAALTALVGQAMKDVLDDEVSRVDNLAGLAEKQNELGEAQLRAAIEVARAFQQDAASTHTARAPRSPGLRYVSFIERLARGAAAKKVATRHRIHVADAIEPSVIRVRAFREEQLPRLARLMSAERRKALGLST